MGGKSSKKDEDADSADEMEMTAPGSNDDSGKYGEPMKHDPNFKGPIENRSCTDIICCVLFLVVMAASGLLAYFAYTNGDPLMLVYPTDSHKKLCGVGELESKPYLFFFDILECARMGPAVALNGCPTPQICLSSCPNSTWTFGEVAALETLPSSQPHKSREKMICKYGVNPMEGKYASMDVFKLVMDDHCAAYYVDSKPFVGRCIPAILHTAVDFVLNATDENGAVHDLVTKDNTTVTNEGLSEGSKYLAQFLSIVDIGKAVLADLTASWWMIVVGLAISALVGLIWILLMRWIAGIMIWISVAAFIGLFGFSTYYCFSKYVELKDLPEASGNFIFTTNLSYYLGLKDTWLAFGIISAVVLAIMLLLLIILRSRILIAIALIEETSKAISHMMFTLLWPIWPFILECGVVVYWGSVAVYLASWTTVKAQYTNGTNTTDANGNVKWDFTPCDLAQGAINDSKVLNDACQFVMYEVQNYIIWLQLANLFVFFWLLNFVIALGQMTLAGAFASYYWAFSKPKDIPTFPIIGSFWRCFRYHLGSLAFGSLIIAIVQIIRAILEYIDHKVKGSENPVAKFFLKCMKCCFWCLEKFLKFINKNAYILIAVYGKNFCTSAKNAFFLLMRNIVRVFVVDKMTTFCLFIAKLVVVAATAIAAYFFFDRRIPYLKDYVPELNYYFIPIIVITVGAYIIATLFFNVYSMGVDTMFLCFLEDLERHDGTPEKPYFMSKSLMKILGKKNKKLKPKEK